MKMPTTEPAAIKSVEAVDRLAASEVVDAPRRIDRIAILLLQVGHSREPIPDPYWQSDDWYAAARGDGASYGGVCGEVRRLPDETDVAMWARAEAEARRIREERS